MERVRIGGGPDAGLIIPLTISKTFTLDGTQAATAANYSTVFWVPDGTHRLRAVYVRYTAAGTDGGAVTVMLKKVPNGTAPASGTDMLSAGISLKGTANTILSGTVTSTDANKEVVAQDGIAVVLTGTPTSVAGLTVETVWARY
jgi:hypothetical protein